MKTPSVGRRDWLMDRRAESWRPTTQLQIFAIDDVKQSRLYQWWHEELSGRGEWRPIPTVKVATADDIKGMKP